MRCAHVPRFGGPDEITIVEVDVPEPGAGEILVRVLTSGVNPLDHKMRDGSSGLVQGFDAFPLLLGRECFGTVERCGAGAEDFSVGEAVFGMPPLEPTRGTHADHVVVDQRHVAAAPSGVDALVLGGTPVAGITAWQTVHHLARVAAGEDVLVIGAGGGVGQWLVQLCVAAGATVYASASTSHHDRLEALGAIHVDYTAGDVADVVPRLDVVLDGVYFGTFEKSLELLKPDGRVVVIPSLADLTPALDRGLWAAKPVIAPDRETLEMLAGLLAAGTVTVEVGAVLPLEQLAQAHGILEEGHAHGKVVIDLRTG